MAHGVAFLGDRICEAPPYWW